MNFNAFKKSTIVITILSILLILLTVIGCMQYYDLQWYKEQYIRERSVAAKYYELYTGKSYTSKTESKASDFLKEKAQESRDRIDAEFGAGAYGGNNSDSGSNSKEVVYWLPTGSVYHLYSDCQHINGKTVKSGTISQSGKPRCCSTCENR